MWDKEVDVLIIGSGGGGMTAALTAHKENLSTLIIEKSPHYGGSTALSGGAIWIPDNHLMQREGIPDDLKDAKTYLKAITNGKTPDAHINNYLEYAKALVQYLENETPIRFSRCHGYTDYFPELPGGHIEGRSLEPIPFNGKILKETFKELNPPIWPVPAGIALTASEYNKVNLANSTWLGKKTLFKILWRALKDFLLRKKTLTLGQSLIAQLRLALKDRDLPIWLNTSFKELIIENNEVIGAIVMKDQKPFKIKANSGVLLAAGGFAQNLAMRQKYQQAPITTDWTNAHKGNTGDAINEGIKLGAKIDLMDDAWWGPCSILPQGMPFFHVAERSLPGAIIVNKNGKRYANEALPYTEFVHEMYNKNSNEAQTIPSYFIMDQRFRKKYAFGLMPAGMTGKMYLKSKYIIKARTLEELADKTGIHLENLKQTVERFNQMASKGKDLDFGKGDSAYDRYYGDSTVQPNPCLHPLEKPPYYCVVMHPGDIGTKGGLVTDEFGRVLKDDNTIIKNLYATGNTSASIMQNSYPGAGGTIGPSMVFGYIAVKKMSKSI